MTDRNSRVRSSGTTSSRTTESEPNDRSPISRRTCLSMAAGSLVAGVVGSSTVSGTTREYETVVDIVDDFGADPTGEEPINDALNEAVRNDTKVIFPEGTYYVGENGFHRWDFGEGIAGERVSNVALVGEGDVTLRPSSDIDHFIFAIWGDKVRIEGFRIDETADDTAVGLSHKCEEHLVIRDVTFEGVSDTPGALTKVGPAVTDPAGTAMVENVHIPDGSTDFTDHTAVWIFPDHAGDILFDRCSIQGVSDNALYGSPPGQPGAGGGSVRVENCFFKNNNVTAIRLGTPGSYAKNCTVITEEGKIPPNPWGAITSRAGWVWYNFDGTYENINVIHDHPAGEGILDHNDDTRDLSLGVKNCRLELNNDESNAIRFGYPGVDTLMMKNVSVTGKAGDGAAIDLGNCKVDAKNLCLSQTGENRDGISLSNVVGSIRNARIDVTGDSIVEDTDSDVSIRELPARGNCPSPSGSHPLDS